MASQMARLKPDLQSRHFILKGLSHAMTSNDVRRAFKGVKGIDRVDLMYRHFKPLPKALITMTLPEHTASAMLACRYLPLRGRALTTEPFDHIDDSGANSPRKSVTNSYTETTGDGPSAGVTPGKTVTLSGFPGKVSQEAVIHLVSDFKLRKVKDMAAVQRVPLPPNKFSLFSRFCVHLESDSEAQRLVRKLHMTPHSGNLIRAEVIY